MAEYGVPNQGGGMNVMFLASVGLLVAVFGVIAAFVIKLYFDERTAQRRRDALMAMTGGGEEEPGQNEGRRRRRVAEEEHLARAMMAADEDEALGML